MSSTLSGSRRLGLAAAAMLSVATLTLSGCAGGGGASNEGGGSENTSVTVFNGATGTIAENFNPFSSTALQPTLGVIFEPLFWYNAASDEPPTPLLAESFEWNEDGTQLTITTREGVQWSDGEPFTANDVAFTFNLVNETPELNTTGLSATAEATDDTTVVLTFQENSFMQEPSVLGNRGIVPEHIWKDVADPITEINSNPVGTGPFKVKDFTAQSYLLEKNDVYWEDGKPAIDEVRYISLDTADAATGALLAGQVDWMSSFLPGLEQILADNENLSYVNTPALTASIFTCSNEELGCEGPQTDPAVRQAIYQGIDREQLNALAGGGFAGTASPTLVLPERDAAWIADPANTETPANADVEEAKKVLEDAGWVEGSDGIREKDGERLTLGIQTVTGYSDFISLNDAMSQQLREVGIELNPTSITYNEWINNLNIGQYQLTLESIGLQPSNNPYYSYEKWYNSANTTPVGESALNNNTSRYSNPVVDEALAVARSTNDEAVQKEQYGIIQEEIVRDMPYIPIYVNSLLTEFNTERATGWPTNEDPYALAATWKAWDNGIVLKNITPAG
jgi:peptide/nickel transport system substrate-binding protein